jgi:hypothetical protein
MHLKLNTRCPTTHQSLQTRTQHHTTQITISQTGCLGRFSRQPQGSSPSRLHATCTQSITHLHTFNNPPTQQTQSPHLTQHPNHNKLSSTPPPAPAITHPQPFSIPARLPTPTTLPPVPYAPASVNSGQREREKEIACLHARRQGNHAPTSSSIQPFISPHARQRCAWLGR